MYGYTNNVSKSIKPLLVVLVIGLFVYFRYFSSQTAKSIAELVGSFMVLYALIHLIRRDPSWKKLWREEHKKAKSRKR